MSRLEGKSKKIALSAAFLALTAVVQIIGLPQPVTGPLINAILATAGVVLGILPAILLGCITPVVALFRGQLPGVLAPMIPFIAAGNSIFIFIFTTGIGINKNAIRNRDITIMYNGITIIAASLAKTITLFLSVTYLVPVIFGAEIPGSVAMMMATPQFITAIIGGITALFLLKFFTNSLSITS